MRDRKTPIDEFVKSAAARTPTPGGGSVAALVGALAAATGEMAIQYSLGKKSLEAFEEELRPALEEFARARQLLLELMEEDQAAYESLSALRKLPADHPERKEKFDFVLLASIRVPQTMGAVAASLLELCDRMVNFVNPNLLSDLAVCADLAMAVVRCAQYNVRANLSSIKDQADRRRFEDANNQILSRAATLVQGLSQRIWARNE
jgi:glutamate formiminotransferase/formiminotetrahydrofolate cyclodeaminase